MKAVGQIVKFIIKNLGKAMKASIPVVKKTATWLKAHPKTATALTTLAVDAVYDYAKQIQDSKESAEYDALIKELSDAKLTIKSLQDALQLQPSKPLTNHPIFWFPESSKVSGFGPLDKGYDFSQIFRNVNMRCLYMRHYNETSIEGKIIGPYAADELYAAYTTYYNRLNLQAPKEKNAVIREFEEMLYKSWCALSYAFTARRFSDSENVMIGSNTAIRHLFTGISPYQIASDEYYQNLTSITGFYPLTVASEVGNQVAWGFRNLNGMTYAGSVKDPCPGHLSNSRYTEVLGKLRNLPISDNAYQLSKYLFSDTFVDKGDDDTLEMYSIFPPLDSDLVPSDDNAGFPKLVGIHYYDAIETIVSQVQAIMESDKAYPTLLTMLKLRPESYLMGTDKQISNPEWLNTISEDLKRDAAKHTLHVRQAGEDLYDSLANADYAIFDNYNKGVTGETWTNAEKAWGPNRVVMGYRRSIMPDIISTIKAVPEPQAVSSGKVASAIKFNSGLFSLMLGPIMYMSGNTVQAVSPFNTTLATHLLGNGVINPLNGLTGDMIAELGRYFNIPLLPMNMKHKLVYNGTDNYTEFEYQVNDGSQYYSIEDIETIRSYMWSNCLFGSPDIKGLVKALNQIDSFLAINP